MHRYLEKYNTNWRLNKYVYCLLYAYIYINYNILIKCI